MKRLGFGVMAALGLVLALGFSSCSSKSKQAIVSPPAEKPGERSEERAVLAWKVSLTSVCTSETPEQCVANYGFSIRADGKYEIGPGPQGQTLIQNLESSEFAQVEEQVQKLLLGLQTESESGEICVPNTHSESQDVLTLVRLGQERKILTTSGTEFCYRTGSMEETGALHNAIREIAKKYYLLPFPDSCRDSVAEVESLYPALTGCVSDADCAYVDSNFLPIPTGERHYVFTENCTLLKPLIVANAALTTKARSLLLGAKKKMADTCGARIARLGCRNFNGFYTGIEGQGPVCVEGACKINPALN